MSQGTLTASPSPLRLRDELEAMVLKELLGPGSVQEEIIESPGTRYFVGVLAPRKRSRGHARADGDSEPAGGPGHVAVGDDVVTGDDGHAGDDGGGEILDGDELALGGRDTSQDGTTDQAPAQDKALIPS